MNRYPFLANLDEYHKTIEFGEKIKQASENFLKQGNYSKVLQYIKNLEHFPIFVEDAKKLKYEATILANFMQLLANKEYDKVYEYVEKEPFLEEIEGFQNIEKNWLQKVSKAENDSGRGDVKAILDSLKNYMKIKDKLPKIGELIKSAYLYQLLAKLKTEVSDKIIEKGFRNYIQIFGLDLEVSDLITLAKKSGRELDFSKIDEGNKFNWYKKHIPYNIFE